MTDFLFGACQQTSDHSGLLTLKRELEKRCNPQETNEKKESEHEGILEKRSTFVSLWLLAQSLVTIALEYLKS